MVDKNQAVIDFLLLCPQIRDNPLYFNFISATEGSKQLITQANDKNIDKPYVDGSVLKRYTFTVIDFQSISPNPVVKIEGYPNENVYDLGIVQTIIDWITEQAKERNYPNFGYDCQIEDMRTTSDNPELNSIDNTVAPALAKYSISIQIDYIDTTNTIWR